jgi:hypothetical protein
MNNLPFYMLSNLSLTTIFSLYTKYVTHILTIRCSIFDLNYSGIFGMYFYISFGRNTAFIGVITIKFNSADNSCNPEML